jgi:hypothetical protein
MSQPKRETRHQRIFRLLREGQCGLLPFDLSCPCPRRDGPERPQPDHPGRVGFLTCHGCQHNAGLFFTSRVCMHANARQTSTRWLGDTIRAWEEEQAQPALQAQLALF